MNPRAVGAVIYALDARKLARFYADVLDFDREEVDEDFVRLVGPQSELVIVQAPAEWTDSVVIESPPALREETAIKFFLQVRSIPEARSQAARLGGGIYDEDREWMMGSFLVVDGFDPEGNIFQLREWVGVEV
ncbi:MAG TPA: VOC family protein [Fimbriimonadaceae bacterium]|mgnify:CR=1 FL=1|nr:VOC family protein [Fimbriimonadaceae bacterium]HRJ32772.1 VOC family protein [Fimbriimonadaceae bacterium]